MSNRGSFSPFHHNFQDWLKHLDMNSIEEYIQDTLSKSMSQPYHFFENYREDSAESNDVHQNALNESVFETHDEVFVMIPIHETISLSELRIFHTSNKTILEGIPKPNDRYVITLPSLVKKKGASASVKNNILQIKLPKTIDTQYTEISLK